MVLLFTHYIIYKYNYCIKVNSTVKQMSKESIDEDTRQDVDSKYPSMQRKCKIELLLYFRPPSKS